MESIIISFQNALLKHSCCSLKEDEGLFLKLNLWHLPYNDKSGTD